MVKKVEGNICSNLQKKREKFISITDNCFTFNDVELNSLKN